MVSDPIKRPSFKDHNNVVDPIVEGPTAWVLWRQLRIAQGSGRLLSRRGVLAKRFLLPPPHAPSALASPQLSSYLEVPKRSMVGGRSDAGEGFGARGGAASRGSGGGRGGGRAGGRSFAAGRGGGRFGHNDGFFGGPGFNPNFAPFPLGFVPGWGWPPPPRFPGHGRPYGRSGDRRNGARRVPRLPADQNQVAGANGAVVAAAGRDARPLVGLAGAAAKAPAAAVVPAAHVAGAGALVRAGDAGAAPAGEAAGQKDVRTHGVRSGATGNQGAGLVGVGAQMASQQPTVLENKVTPQSMLVDAAGSTSTASPPQVNIGMAVKNLVDAVDDSLVKKEDTELAKRSCYRCGERGHLHMAFGCPMLEESKQVALSVGFADDRLG
ncbi:hypothetical protein ACP4OV_022366 [Aristida adscensionis]